MKWPDSAGEWKLYRHRQPSPKEALVCFGPSTGLLDVLMDQAGLTVEFPDAADDTTPHGAQATLW
ncbi:hypothetical protein LK459_02650 [Gordonia otitidis]|uniref:hypothetical protein n=1 Tax=Gordonia otitidis TaxID=249058 RepID=UPI001D13BAC8|nr:hypothetical protein [Gordonia otitidis]UEA59808.1 hypothetical protein LK459_02650 [Gordonia otitidis]